MSKWTQHLAIFLVRKCENIAIKDSNVRTEINERQKSSFFVYICKLTTLLQRNASEALLF